MQHTRQHRDYVDEVTEEAIKGLRKYGSGKEHRPDADLSLCILSVI